MFLSGLHTPTAEEWEKLNDTFGPIYKLHWKEIPKWTLREESLYGQKQRGHKFTSRSALIYRAKTWPCSTPTACYTDSIAKKPNLALQLYLNKENEDADMLEYCHTLTQLRKHFCYSRHYEVQLSLEHDLASDHPQDSLEFTITLRGPEEPHIGSKGHKLQQTYRLFCIHSLLCNTHLTDMNFKTWYQTRLGCFVKPIAQ